MEAKRDLFDELVEGFDALKDQRETQRPLRTVRVEAMPATLKRRQDVETDSDLSEHHQGLTLSAKQTT